MNMRHIVLILTFIGSSLHARPSSGEKAINTFMGLCSIGLIGALGYGQVKLIENYYRPRPWVSKRLLFYSPALWFAMAKLASFSESCFTTKKLVIREKMTLWNRAKHAGLGTIQAILSLGALEMIAADGYFLYKDLNDPRGNRSFWLPGLLMSPSLLKLSQQYAHKSLQSFTQAFAQEDD